MPVISAEHVYKSYGSLQAVADLSFRVEKSQCFGFLGPNGAGKTSMMKMIYGKAHRDQRADSRLRVFGCDPHDDELLIKQRSGVVLQDDALDEDLNVRQNLRIYARFYGMSRRRAERRIDEMLTFMELTAKSSVPIKQLSGGMQRRLAIARALLNEPELLILDEPTTGLDPQVRHLIWNKLRTLQSDGVTILLTTHYMEEAFQICDEILIMDGGKAVMAGPPRRLLEDSLERYVLEVPLVSVDPHSAGAIDGPGPEVRVEEHDGTRYFFSSDSRLLEAIAEQLPRGRTFIRQVNLEDLFLHTTGRELNAAQ